MRKLTTRQIIHINVVNKKSKVTNKQKNLRTADILPSLCEPADNVSRK